VRCEQLRGAKPEEKPEGWPDLVSSHGIEVGDEFVLFDSLAVQTSCAGARALSS
jgi:hypothetical protein